MTEQNETPTFPRIAGTDDVMDAPSPATDTARLEALADEFEAKLFVAQAKLGEVRNANFRGSEAAEQVESLLGLLEKALEMAVPVLESYLQQATTEDAGLAGVISSPLTRFNQLLEAVRGERGAMGPAVSLLRLFEGRAG